MKTNHLFLAGVLSIGLLASCAGNEGNEPNTQKGKSETLTISLAGIGTRVTDITTDPASGTAESTVNSAVIAITDGAAGNIKSIHNATISGSTATATISSINTGDSVLVAVNVPSAFSYTGVTTGNEFHKLATDIDNALGSDGTTVGAAETGKNLPMYGSTGTFTSSETGYAASVNVYHLASKITLSSLAVNFDATGSFSSASFTPTEVFLYNVPDHVQYSYQSPWYTAATYYQGESTNSTNIKAYLGTGVFSPALTTLKGTVGTAEIFDGSTGTSLYLYTMPNNNTSIDTRLIIKGTFSADGKGDDNATVYYPVSINHIYGNSAPYGNDKCIYPNHNYCLTVLIKGRGNVNVTDPVDPASLSATLTVQTFNAVNQSNTFN